LSTTTRLVGEMAQAMCGLSFDVEELFHARLRGRFPFSLTREYYEAPYAIREIIRLLEAHEASATFFFVGDIVEKFPELVNLVRQRGHEVAFHGYYHKPLWELGPDGLKAELMAFRELVGDFKGFRAPTFSLNNRTIWAIEVMEQAGLTYDSSVFPVRALLYGVPRAPIKPYRPSKKDLRLEDPSTQLLELPPLIYQLCGFRLPAAGGFYARILPTSILIRAIMKRMKEGCPAILFFHTWEVCPVRRWLQMGLADNLLKKLFIHKSRKVLERLLTRFKFVSLIELAEEWG